MTRTRFALLGAGLLCLLPLLGTAAPMLEDVDLARLGVEALGILVGQ